MDRATEIAHRIIPDAGSEWPLSEHGRAVLMQRAATIIRDEIAAEREACARIADAHDPYLKQGVSVWRLPSMITSAIRGRTQP